MKLDMQDQVEKTNKMRRMYNGNFDDYLADKKMQED